MIKITDLHKEIMYGIAIKQYSKIGNMPIHNGHEIYKMAIDDGTISKADGTIDTLIDEHNRPYKKVNIKYEMGYLYLGALNLNSAHKKFNKILKDVDDHITNSEIANTSSLKGEEHKSETNT